MGVASAACLLVAGWLIGATGIGGVLVVPALTALDGVPLQRAIAASSLAFALPGIAALAAFVRGGGRWAAIAPVLAGAALGALAGASLVHAAPARVLLAGLAALALASGWRGLRTGAHAHDAPPLHRGLSFALGAAVGAGSALTGTGGPVLLLPLLMFLRQPVALTVAAAQAVQLPIALCAGFAHARTGQLDLRLAALLAAVLLAGSLAGQWSARRMPVAGLQRLVAVLLLATGAWLAGRALLA